MKGHHWFLIGLAIVGVYLLYKKGIIKHPSMQATARIPASGAEV